MLYRCFFSNFVFLDVSAPQTGRRLRSQDPPFRTGLHRESPIHIWGRALSFPSPLSRTMPQERCFFAFMALFLLSWAGRSGFLKLEYNQQLQQSIPLARVLLFSMLKQKILSFHFYMGYNYRCSTRNQRQNPRQASRWSARACYWIGRYPALGFFDILLRIE